MSDEQQHIEQLEKQLKDLEEVLWKFVEANTTATNLISEMTKRWKPGTQEKDSEHLNLLVRCRKTFLTCQELLAQKGTLFQFGVLLNDLSLSINEWRKRVGDELV